MHFDKTKYKVWTWKNPLMLHIIINPGMAFNELVLGQRTPRLILIEKGNREKPLSERSFIPCPHCGTIHPANKWSAQNRTAFKNWFGLYCDRCGGIIPCLTNMTSYLILGITFPIWIWFKKSWKEKWLAAQKEKFSRPVILTQQDFSWWKTGVLFGFLMLVVMSMLSYKDLNWRLFLTNLLPLCLITGFVFGLFLKKVTAGKK